MKTQNIIMGISISLLILVSSCSKDSSSTDPVPPAPCTVDAPATYSFTYEGENTVSYTGQQARLAKAYEVYNVLDRSLTSSTPVVAITMSELDAIIDDANSKLLTKTAENDSKWGLYSHTDVITDLNEILQTYCDNSATFALGTAASEGVAGWAGSYQVDANGWEGDQQFAKMLIGALCLEQINYDYLTKMMDCAAGETWCTDNTDRTDTYTQREHYYDEGFGYVYGLDDNELDAQINNGLLLGKYLNKHDGTDYSMIDFRQQAYDAFKKGRQAVVENCATVLDQQIAIINTVLSKVVAWHAADYLRSSANQLSTDPVKYHHSVSEAWGFIYSLQFTKMSNGLPLFSSSEVNGMIAELEAGDGSNNGAHGLNAQQLNAMADMIDAAVGTY